MEDDGSARRQRRQGVMYSQEQVEQGLESMALLEQRKRDTVVKKRMLALVNTFSQGETIAEREPAAQELMQVMNDPETSQDVRRFLQSRNQQVKFVEWTALRKTTKDIGELGEISQKLVDPDAPFNPQRSLQDLIDDPTFDPGAKEFARHFQKYLPKYNAFKNKQDPGFTDGDKMGKSGTKDVILDKNGKLIMKPNGSDDPRLVGTLIRNFEPMLEKEGRDSTAESMGKSVLTDEARGIGYITVVGNDDTSPMMKRLGKYMQEKAQLLDPKRSRQYDPKQNTRLLRQQQEKAQREKEKAKKTKKKGFGGLFGRD